MTQISLTFTESGLRVEISDLRNEAFYCMCSENKGTDQLCSYCTAVLRLCYRLVMLLVSYAAAQFFLCFTAKHLNSQNNMGL